MLAYFLSYPIERETKISLINNASDISGKCANCAKCGHTWEPLGDDNMALIKCPECNREISDKAIACPHRGYPLNSSNNNQNDTELRYNVHVKISFGFG